MKHPYHADEVYITNEASPYVIFHSGLDTDEIRKEVTSDLNKVNLTEGVDFYVEIN